MHLIKVNDGVYFSCGIVTFFLPFVFPFFFFVLTGQKKEQKDRLELRFSS
jgi:hypothetical protein